MKKILSFLFLLVVAVSLVACRDKDGDDTPAARTYVVDGQFTAIAANDNHGAPQLTWVTVTIENDQIKSFYIDQLQTKDGAWNAKTKKELGYAYRMHGQWTLSEEEYIAYLQENNKKEWFEQAALIEAQLLVSTDVAVNAEGYIQGISGVSIADNDYIALAKKAVENAKAGIINTFVANVYNGSINLVLASGKVNAEGKIVEAKLDERQTKDGAWNAKTKQELGTDYGMSAAKIDKNGDGITLEWFEQANAITTAWLAGSNISDITSVSGVTITDNDYNTVLAKLAQGWTK